MSNATPTFPDADSHNVTAATYYVPAAIRSASVSTSPSPSAIDIVNIAIGLVGVLANLFACFVIIGHQPLRKRLPDYFIVNQCVLDLVVGLVLILYVTLKFGYVAGGAQL